MNIIKSLSKSIQFVACALSMSLMVLSCANNELDEGRGYGYVQFRLFKAESYTKSTVEKLAFLSDACKIQVKLRSENGKSTYSAFVNSGKDLRSLNSTLPRPIALTVRSQTCSPSLITLKFLNDSETVPV